MTNHGLASIALDQGLPLSVRAATMVTLSLSHQSPPPPSSGFGKMPLKDLLQRFWTVALAYLNRQYKPNMVLQTTRTPPARTLLAYSPNPLAGNVYNRNHGNTHHHSSKCCGNHQLQNLDPNRPAQAVQQAAHELWPKVAENNTTTNLISS